MRNLQRALLVQLDYFDAIAKVSAISTYFLTDTDNANMADTPDIVTDSIGTAL
jgi:hypothetical protein